MRCVSDEIANLSKEWRNLGVSESVLREFLNYQDVSAITCHGIEENGAILALFEKRDTVRAYKNMSILFSPRFKLDDGEYEEISEEITKASIILEKIFLHLMGEPLSERGQIKIYNDTPYVSAVLIKMAEYIKTRYSDRYTIKLYRN